MNILVSCSLFQDPEEELIFNVDNQFELQLKEILHESNRELVFTLISLDAIACEATSLEINMSSNYNEINLDVVQVNYPEQCGENYSYPEGQTFLEIEKKTYNLGINILDFIKHEGTLSSDDAFYTLDLVDSKGLISSLDKLNRIPDNFIWGYQQTFTDNEKEKISNFFKNNDWPKKIPEDLNRGTYSYFTVDQFGNFKMDNLPQTGIIRTFAIMNTSIHEASRLVNSFKTENPEIRITFFASDGSTF